ncbi:MAG: hypothetical protein A3F16_05925 [Deltaproteobacteria bacterium RIFCSPHIGHO2_12_FULL_43_9]|nr:MAG: hypothetical protein A3F16_05925 [Deltaproteobacteria bacterium RIFCSPHIGHO2_12_FULL_43_9]
MGQYENYNDKQQREAFHLLFLERLLKISNPTLYVLKGGVNLRYFFNSPRYSEDMDLDALAGGVETLRKNGYKILEDISFRRSLRVYGIEELRLNDPRKAKQTGITQRFRLRLVNLNGEEFPTKIEFSRRGIRKSLSDDYKSEMINPEIVRPYRRLSFACQHYLSGSVAEQKINALAHRAVPQARDPFDIYILYSGGFIPKLYQTNLTKNDSITALEKLHSLTYYDYLGQVVEYLDQEYQPGFRSKEQWNLICKTTTSLLQSKKK